jgi:zinc protease
MKKILLSLLALSFPLPSQAALDLANTGKNKNFLYEQDSKALASSVQLVFRTGSLSDPKGKEGLATISFQALLRGTKNKARKDFFAAVEQLGASLSADTGSNRTIITLDTISENLEGSLQLLAEAVLQPGLKDSEIKSLIDEELAQLQQELGNNRAILKRVFRQAAFGGTALAFPPEGTIEGLKAITPDDVRAFLAAQLKSGGVVVAAMSNHPQKTVEAWVERAFANFPEGVAPATAQPALQAPNGRTLYVVERKGSSVTEIALGHLGIEAARKDREVLEAGLFVLGGDMSSRLFQVLRGQNGWTYGAYSSFQMLEIPRRHGGAFLIYTFPQGEHTEKATLKALEIYQDYATKGVTAKELSFAKKSLANSYSFKFATSRSRLTARLYEHLDGAPNRSVSAYKKLVNGITRASLLAAVKKAHDPENLNVVAVGDPEKIAPLKKSIPGLSRVVVVEDPMGPLPAANP